MCYMKTQCSVMVKLPSICRTELMQAWNTWRSAQISYMQITNMLILSSHWLLLARLFLSNIHPNMSWFLLICFLFSNCLEDKVSSAWLFKVCVGLSLLHYSSQLESFYSSSQAQNPSLSDPLSRIITPSPSLAMLQMCPVITALPILLAGGQTLLSSLYEQLSCNCPSNSLLCWVGEHHTDNSFAYIVFALKALITVRCFDGHLPVSRTLEGARVLSVKDACPWL